MELIISNDLAVSIEGDVQRYKTTAKGMEALRHLRKLERLMPEREDLAEEGVLS